MNIEDKVLESYRDRNLATGKVCRLLELVCKAEDRLFETLNEGQQKLYRNFNDAEMKLHCDELDDAVLYGFRFAVSLINQLNKIDLGEEDG